MKFEAKFPQCSPKIAPKICSDISSAFLAARKSSPNISPDCSQRFQISNRISPKEITTVSGMATLTMCVSCFLFRVVGIPQRQSNMHQVEVHHFASPFAPNLLVGQESGFIVEICGNSRSCSRKRGFSGAGKGPIPPREDGGEGETNGNHILWCMFDSP